MTTPTPSDWSSRLVVRYTDDSGKDVEISPIQSFTPTFTTTSEALHSLERTHIGVVHSPAALTFTMTVTAVGPVAAHLTALALKGKRFDLTLAEKTGNDWSFSTLVMADCLITSAGPTAATISGAPQAQFSGYSMRVDATDTAGGKTSVPARPGS